MEQLIIYSGLVLFGVTLGSFAGAQVWRLRARQLKEDKADGEVIDENEYRRLRPLLNSTVKDDRSKCLQCHHPLAWYDLLPLVSWMRLGGKCRYCRKPIGRFEPLMEIGTASYFVISYAFWPNELTEITAVAQFVIWLIAGVGLAILFAYDAKWFLLPNKVMFPLMGLSAVSVLLQVLSSSEPLVTVASAVGAVGVLSGLYLALYIVSRGVWVGFGDIKLGVVLGLLLADWKLALLALFLANLIGTLIVLPGMLSKRLTRKSQVPFGPMLIGGWLIAGIFGGTILNWYLGGLYF